jgi:2-dehydropantoate 2-reductase
MKEALVALKKAGIPLEKHTFLHPRFYPAAFKLPTPIFKLLAAPQVQIDPGARLSMWQDLENRRLTEVDHLNGAVVALAQSVGLDAPLNRKAIELIQEAEKKGNGSPQLPSAELAKAFGLV